MCRQANKNSQPKNRLCVLSNNQKCMWQRYTFIRLLAGS